jgi:hypothetical protein
MARTKERGNPMAPNPTPESDLFGPAPLSNANQNLDFSLNDEEWAAIDDVLDRMHRELVAAKKNVFPGSENQ